MKRQPPDPGFDPHDFMPVSHLAYHVLLALADETRHGWAIIRRIDELTDGRTKPSSGSLYLAMIRLEERGLIAVQPSPDNADSRRRYYALTPNGGLVLRTETERLATLVRHAQQTGATGRQVRP